MERSIFLLWLRIIGWAILVHIMLIAFAFLEVFIYSLIKPGLAEAQYTEHAKWSGPYISIFMGFILFFLIARRLSKIYANRRLIIGLTLPIIYTIIDFLILHFYGTDWTEHLVIFIISFLCKTMGSLLGAFYKTSS